ncbi:MAG: class I SAM-dependent methyltransferase [Gemmatimonadetes bacterium]|nr:class I SAM-dependent methyltransferase [Gemmatimonadota bacterium]
MPDDNDKILTRTDYRRVIAWPERIVREAPFLEWATRDAPHRSLLDVGCGSGEHTRHFAEAGWTAVGVDVSDRMMEEAVSLSGPAESGGSARFELRDGRDARDLAEAPFGAALCLGNAFAFLETEDDVRSLLHGVADGLAPGAPFLMQMLNYERICSSGQRALPVNVRPLPEDEGDGEILFLRIMTPRPDGNVDFYPITLTLRPGEEPEVDVRSVKSFVHHGWRLPFLRNAYAEAGFDDLQAFGGMAETEFVEQESADLVILARRKG